MEFRKVHKVICGRNMVCVHPLEQNERDIRYIEMENNTEGEGR
jgi:hypothetical protein